MTANTLLHCFAIFLHCGRGTASINSAVERPLGIDADKVQRDDGSPILHPSSSLSRPRATHRTIMQSKLYMLTSTCKLNGNEAHVAFICLLCFALPCIALLCFAQLCFALLRLALLSFALPCIALFSFALLCLPFFRKRRPGEPPGAVIIARIFCFALLFIALLCFALLSLAMPCFVYLCFA